MHHEGDSVEIGKIEILLDKRWELRDFSIVTKEYVQLYSFFYVLSRVETEEYLEVDFSTYPWGGGFSVVNFFQKSYGLTKKEDRLQITKLKYASPGLIELSGAIGIAADVAALVGTLCGSLFTINKTVDSIISSYHKRKLGKIQVQEAESKLKRDDITFIQNSIKQLSSDFKLTAPQIEAVKKITNNNELVQLKILLALYRRAEPIVEQQESGKATL